MFDISVGDCDSGWGSRQCGCYEVPTINAAQLHAHPQRVRRAAGRPMRKNGRWPVTPLSTCIVKIMPLHHIVHLPAATLATAARAALQMRRAARDARARRSKQCRPGTGQAPREGRGARMAGILLGRGPWVRARRRRLRRPGRAPCARARGQRAGPGAPPGDSARRGASDVRGCALERLPLGPGIWPAPGRENTSQSLEGRERPAGAAAVHLVETCQGRRSHRAPKSAGGPAAASQNATGPGARPPRRSQAGRRGIPSVLPPAASRRACYATRLLRHCARHQPTRAAPRRVPGAARPGLRGASFPLDAAAPVWSYGGGPGPPRSPSPAPAALRGRLCIANSSGGRRAMPRGLRPASIPNRYSTPCERLTQALAPPRPRRPRGIPPPRRRRARHRGRRRRRRATICAPCKR